jgi:predicted outer membrane repeat protein
MADINGGGMVVIEGSSVMTNVNFTDNMANKYGGGMYVFQGSSVMTNVNFTDNMADNCGGLFDQNNTSKMTNITFTMNTATDRGGGLCNNSLSSVITNTLFSGNKAKSGGGLFSNDYETTYTNVTVSGNSATEDGGGIYAYAGNPTVYNSIFWNNLDSSGSDTISATIYLASSAKITLTNSIVEGSGGSGSWALDQSKYIDGDFNKDTDPLFITPVDLTTAPTDFGDLRLTMNSPAIDTGGDQYITEILDLDNNPRKVDGDGDGDPTVDMGAYEYQPKHQLSIYKNGTGDGTVTSAPPGLDCGDTCIASFTQGSSVTLTAVPIAGSTFSGWSGDCSNAGDCVLTIDAAKSVTATFDLGLADYLPLVKR